MKYTITDKKLIENGDIKDTIIEKHGYVPTFTMNQLEENVRYSERHLKELEGKLTIEQAKIDNIEFHHSALIGSMTELERYTVHMYQESAAFAKAIRAKISELRNSVDEDRAEMAEVKNQIPELAAEPSPYQENAAPAAEGDAGGSE